MKNVHCLAIQSLGNVCQHPELLEQFAVSILTLIFNAAIIGTDAFWNSDQSRLRVLCSLFGIVDVR